MATLTDYKGLDIVEGATGAGGAAITGDFKLLADRAPQQSAGNPTATDDASKGYFVGSLWLNTTSSTLLMCVDSTNGSAVWKSVFSRSGTDLKLAPANDGSVTVSGMNLGFTKQVSQFTGFTSSGTSSGGIELAGYYANGRYGIFVDNSDSFRIYTDAGVGISMNQYGWVYADSFNAAGYIHRPGFAVDTSTGMFKAGTYMIGFSCNQVGVLQLSEDRVWVAASEIDFTALPTSDPVVAGRLWNDSGTVKISAG